MLLLIWLHSLYQCAQRKMRADTLHIQDEELSVPCIVYAGGCSESEQRHHVRSNLVEMLDGDRSSSPLPAWPGAPMHCWLTPAPPVAKLPENQAMVTGKAEDLQNTALLSWCSLPCKCRKKSKHLKSNFSEDMNDLILAKPICRLSRMMWSKSTWDEFSWIRMSFTLPVSSQWHAGFNVSWILELANAL